MNLRHAATELLRSGYLHISDAHTHIDDAWARARAIFDTAAEIDALSVGMPPLAEVGRFNIPPPDAIRRDFQALHLDFGLPVEPAGTVDVARFTALHIAADRGPTSALTRIVLLRRLLGQRAWPEPAELLGRLRRYGDENSENGEGGGYVEGIFARLIEAADCSQTLPGAHLDGQLCGMEFGTLGQEREHLAARSLDLDRVEERILLAPGKLLLFDNLATAHGRLGRRGPLELHQLCVGFASLDADRQAVLRDRVLAAFEPKEPDASPAIDLSDLEPERLVGRSGAGCAPVRFGTVSTTRG